MSMSFNIGDLVYDPGEMNFTGIGKLESIDEVEGVGIVGFFSSPQNPSDRAIKVNLQSLELAELFDEQNVYVLDEHFNIWRRARYGGARPCGNHFIMFTKDENDNFDDALVAISEIYILNLDKSESLNPAQFLNQRYVDPPFFYRVRQAFLKSYIDQRAACRSISAIPSSSIELEPHQLAIVRRVLQDDTKKYLLADEVGLGKTIEAGIILKELLLKDNIHQVAVVGVPSALVMQWKDELINRFHLGDLINQSLIICSHEELSDILNEVEVDILILDEAHQISPWAWSCDAEASNYKSIANAAHKAESCLLLSGTPLSRNEKNFLAMLHLIAPESYEISEFGLKAFKTKVLSRERLGGIYQSLTVRNDNGTLTSLIEQIKELFGDDKDFLKLADQAKPHLDWLASSDGPERTEVIRKLRYYVGENYRLHQRLLRNRRTDPGIFNLFPGLAGVDFKYWPYDGVLSVEQILDAHRAEYFDSGKEYLVLKPDNFLEWIEGAFISPSQVASRAETGLAEFAESLSLEEKDVLGEIVMASRQEQKAKDMLLSRILNSWLFDNSKGKVIVFCTDPIVADNVLDFLEDQIDHVVERHMPGVMSDFSSNNGQSRVLVCDEAGEDGLNLNGGKKLLLHYSQPLSFSRIEQRIGRVNRYSAHIYAAPIENIVLAPQGDGYSQRWQKILVDAVKIYEESAACLQYVLEEHIGAAWRDLPINGIKSLDNLYELLAGETGLVVSERQKVVVQEQLNRMDEDIAAANIFSQQVTKADESAEGQKEMMMEWITKALRFDKVQGEYPDTFRFKYHNDHSDGPRTLMDFKTLVESCVTGIDNDASNHGSIITSMMSADRLEASHGRRVYPFRFGQPFVDAIYEAMKLDSRGICTAVLRQVSVSRVKQITTFFKLDYLHEGDIAEASYSVQRKADEMFPPYITSQWYLESGELVSSNELISFLNSNTAKDIQIRLRHWEALNEYYSAESWAKLVNSVVNSVEDLFHNDTGLQGYKSRLIAVKVIFVVPL